MVDLLNLEPHKVSRDLRGYSILIYGDPKSGKTTIASQFPGALLLAFEKGYSALPGVFAQPMNGWTDMFKAMKQLRSEDAKNKFETIVIDTADLAYDACEKYVCNIHGVDKIGDMPYGAGYAEAGRLLDGVLQELSKLGYGVVIISHSDDKTIKDENGEEYQRIQPTLPRTPRRIINRFCDIIGYSRIARTTDENDQLVEKTYLYMRATIRFEAGSRFKHTPSYIEFTYENLVNAIANAVEKQEQEIKGSVTDEKADRSEKVIDYEAASQEFTNLASALMEADRNNQKKIESIIEGYIGKGKRVAELSKDNAPVIDCINEDLKKLLPQQ